MADEVRLIDGNALKEDFMNDFNNYMMESLRGNHHDTIRISNVIERIEDAPTIEAEPDKDWISVKDRLPEPRTWVLAYIEYPSPVFELERGIRKTGNIRKMFYDGFYDALGDYKVGNGKVTHWQPLPKPPKGEE